jgi:hypothetical protein
MGYRSVSPDYSPKTPPPIEDDFFRAELKDMADVRMKDMGLWPKSEAREEKYRPPEYVEGEPVQGKPPGGWRTGAYPSCQPSE